MKKILISLISICLILSSVSVCASASTNAQGYATYRDGAGINLNWHSGFIYSSGYYSSNTVAHVDNGENGTAANNNHLINYVSLTTFISDLEFCGYYVPRNFKSLSTTEVNNIKDNVLTTIEQLQARTKDYLVYNFTNQIWYKNDSNNNGKVEVSEITSMRCDGLIEYCYEKCGSIIYGDNISIYDTSIRNDHSLLNITPKKQATTCMQNCLGDINYDYRVTAADARLAMNYSSMLETDFDRYQLFVADVNGDGAITAADSRLIMNYSAGLITIFPADPLNS